jgi:hypothetical protein
MDDHTVKDRPSQRTAIVNIKEAFQRRQAVFHIDMTKLRQMHRESAVKSSAVKSLSGKGSNHKRINQMEP